MTSISIKITPIYPILFFYQPPIFSFGQPKGFFIPIIYINLCVYIEKMIKEDRGSDDEIIQLEEKLEDIRNDVEKLIITNSKIAQDQEKLGIRACSTFFIFYIFFLL